MAAIATLAFFLTLTPHLSVNDKPDLTTETPSLYAPNEQEPFSHLKMYLLATHLEQKGLEASAIEKILSKLPKILTQEDRDIFASYSKNRIALNHCDQDSQEKMRIEKQKSSRKQNRNKNWHR